jgi:probable rRNA maturation factor
MKTAEPEFYFNDETTDYGPELEKMERALVKHLISTLKITKPIMLSSTVVDDNKIKELNRDYRHLDSPTDVISFAYDDDMTDKNEPFDDLGEIVISFDTALRQAAFYAHPAEREIAFLFIHGFLHLLGYDHTKSEEEAEKMFSLQNDILNSFSYDYQEVKR